MRFYIRNSDLKWFLAERQNISCQRRLKKTGELTGRKIMKRNCTKMRTTVLLNYNGFHLVQSNKASLFLYERSRGKSYFPSQCFLLSNCWNLENKWFERDFENENTLSQNFKRTINNLQIFITNPLDIMVSWNDYHRIWSLSPQNENFSKLD